VTGAALLLGMAEFFCSIAELLALDPLLKRQ